MTVQRPKRLLIGRPRPYELSPKHGLGDEDMDTDEQPDNSDSLYGSDHDGGAIPDSASNASADLSTLRRMCKDSGYHSLLAAALEEARSYRNSSAPNGYMGLVRKDLDELCRTYLELGVFSKCHKAIDNGLGDGACALSLPILLHQFNKIRLHDFFNKYTNIGTAEFHASFDLPQIYEALEKVSPQFIRFITSMLSTSESNSPEAKRLVVMIAAMLANVRNSHSNYIQKVMGMYLYALKTPKRVITSLNHIGLCVSHPTLLRDLRDAASGARKRLRALGSNGLAFVPVFDNLTFKTKVHQERVENQAEFMTFTAGYVLVPPATRSAPMFNRRTDIIEDNIHTLQVMDFLPTETDHVNIGLAFRAIIAKTLTEFAKFEGVKIAKLDYDFPAVFRIDRTDSAELLPLPTYDLNEAVCNDMIRILYSIQKDTGLSAAQCNDGLQFYAGDLMTVEGMRRAKYRQSECTDEFRLRNVEATPGMFHLFIAALALFFRVHFGDSTEFGSLSFWMDFLQRDRGKLWKVNEASHVQDFNACLDFFGVLLDGYILAALSQIMQFSSVSDLRNALPTLSASTLEKHIESLVALVSKPSEVCYIETDGGGTEEVNLSNTIILLKHGLLLKTFHSAMRIGDTGLMLNALKFLSIWFQGSNNHKYATECLRLTAALNKVYSKRLAKFWMEIALVNLSGKPEGFMALDAWNEHIVREVQGMIPDNLTPVTSAHARYVCSLLIMNFRDIRQHVAEQLNVGIFDHHSSRVCPWRDSKAVANKLLVEGIARAEIAAEPKDKVVAKDSPGRNLYFNGLSNLATGERIHMLKEKWNTLEDFDIEEDEDDELSDWPRVDNDSESEYGSE